MTSSPTAGKVCLIPRNFQPGMLEEYVLTGEQTTIGRHPSNDIVLALESISRFHARIDSRGDYFILQDLNSSNGSYVNSEKVTQLAIHNGDQVTFGNIEFDFHNEASDPGMVQSSSMIGKDILDIREDKHDAARGTTQSVLRAEQVQSKVKSSVITSTDTRADKATLVKLNLRLSALYRLSEMLRELDFDSEHTILEKVLDVIFDAIPADRGVILTRVHPESEDLDVGSVKYRDKPIVAQKVTVSRTMLDQVLNDQISILSRDAQADDRFSSSESIIATKIRSAICAPMIIADRVIGAVFLDTMNMQKQFTQEDLEFVTIVASETGVALANLRLRREVIHRQRLAAVGETVAGISHNVKNILLLSQGGAELLSRAFEKEDIKGAKDAWAVVSRGIDKIGKLVRDMLEYSNQKQPDLTEIDINDLICQTAEEVEEQLISSGVTLELDLDEDIEPRTLDELGLQRTIANLIVNAMEAIKHKDGCILVTTGRRPDRSLIITVKDNGSGIPEDKLNRIFFPFFTTKGSSGTGLGLSMCKKCIEDMGGTITCESKENIGTTFTIEIPFEVSIAQVDV
ncbi:MAG: FHA domain-containing protein [Candidatus Sumerlaeia bacterium]|nr:FHA domain-containing protein [Candidatus Sumerlaeia bacterium]